MSKEEKKLTRKEAEKIKDELHNMFLMGIRYASNMLSKRKSFEQCFDEIYPLEYIPFEYTDFNEFMLKEVRRKGESFKDERFEVSGCFKRGVFLNDGYDLGKMFSSMFEEWEFIDGRPFGKLKQ